MTMVGSTALDILILKTTDAWTPMPTPRSKAVASANLERAMTGLRHRVEAAGNIKEETHQLRPRTDIWTMITGNSEATMAASSVGASRTIAEEMASITKMLTTGA